MLSFIVPVFIKSDTSVPPFFGILFFFHGLKYFSRAQVYQISSVVHYVCSSKTSLHNELLSPRAKVLRSRLRLKSVEKVGLRDAV